MPKKKELRKIEFKNKKILKKKFCVLCLSKKIKKVIDFGKTPLANSYQKKYKTKEFYFPLTCLLCQACGHLQLGQIINPKIMFKNYLYVTGTSKVLKKHFINYAEKIISNFRLNRNSKILDIACNDGTFLEYFKKKRFKTVVGIDPALNLRKLNLKKKIDINTGFFSSSYSKLIKKKYGYFDLITANNVFAHSPYLYDFSLGVKNLLSKRGIFIIEVSYLKTVLEKKTFDTIYHEHMSYHALKPLVSFFKKIGLQVFDYELIEAQGGSIRIFVSKINSYKIKISKIAKCIKSEEKNLLFRNKKYKKFYKDIIKTKIQLKNLISKLQKKDYKIIGYGAPAKLTTLTHVFDLSKKDIKIVIDDNSLKINKYTPGKKILIKGFDYLKQHKNRYNIILVLAWNFYNSIKTKCKNLNKKFLLIKPFPKPKIE